MTEIVAQMLADIDRDMVEAAKKMFKVEGDWYYRDLPKMLPELFDKLVITLGEENIRWITMAEYVESDGSITRRGQMIYNEQARLNAGAYSKK